MRLRLSGQEHLQMQRFLIWNVFVVFSISFACDGRISPFLWRKGIMKSFMQPQRFVMQFHNIVYTRKIPRKT